MDSGCSLAELMLPFAYAGAIYMNRYGKIELASLKNVLRDEEIWRFLIPSFRLTRLFVPTFLGLMDRKLAEDYEC